VHQRRHSGADQERAFELNFPVIPVIPTSQHKSGLSTNQTPFRWN